MLLALPQFRFVVPRTSLLLYSWFGHQAHIRAGLLSNVKHVRDYSIGRLSVPSHIHATFAGLPEFLCKQRGQIVHIHLLGFGLSAQVDVAVLIDADNHSFWLRLFSSRLL